MSLTLLQIAALLLVSIAMALSLAHALELPLGMQGVYWLVTHPVNKAWLERSPLGAAGSRFFGAGGRSAPGESDWTHLRDRWERSHVARAVLAFGSFTALVLVVSDLT